MKKDKTEFQRGIKQVRFLDKLKSLYTEPNSFWQKMVDDDELFIGIRDEYLNVYFKGQSLCKLSYCSKTNTIKGETHQKYLGGKDKGYYVSNDGLFIKSKSDIKSLANIESLKERILPYSGLEKQSSYNDILKDELSIIDVEITFVRHKTEQEIEANKESKTKYKTMSIDYLAIEDSTLVFYEAKHFSNSEIRSTTSPKVFEQIKKYENALEDHKNEILNTYQRVLENLSQLNINTKIAETEGLKLDTNPRLIVYGVDKNERDDKHLNILKEKFKDRLIIKEKNDNNSL